MNKLGLVGKYCWGLFKKKKKGAALTEYGMVAGLIAVLSLGAIATTGDQVYRAFCLAANGVGEQVAGATGDPFTPLAGCAFALAPEDEENPFIPDVPFGEGEVVFTLTGARAQVALGNPTPGTRIDWGDGTLLPISASGTYQHTYTTSDDYVVRVETDGITSISFQGTDGFTNMVTFGDVGITSIANAFAGLDTIAYIAPLPYGVVSINGAFQNSVFVNPIDLSGWDVAEVTNFANLFQGTQGPALDVSSWDTLSVTNVTGMFQGSQLGSVVGLEGWDVVNVTTYNQAFENATINPDVVNWNVTKATSMTRMFNQNTAFNRSLVEWCVPYLTARPVQFIQNLA